MKEVKERLEILVLLVCVEDETNLRLLPGPSPLYDMLTEIGKEKGKDRQAGRDRRTKMQNGL